MTSPTTRTRLPARASSCTFQAGPSIGDSFRVPLTGVLAFGRRVRYVAVSRSAALANALDQVRARVGRRHRQKHDLPAVGRNNLGFRDRHATWRRIVGPLAMNMRLEFAQ